MNKKDNSNSSYERIVLRLDKQIAFERDFSEQYQSVPRARRQEWIRSVLRAGLANVEKHTNRAASSAKSTPYVLLTIPEGDAAVSALQQNGSTSNGGTNQAVITR